MPRPRLEANATRASNVTAIRISTWRIAELACRGTGAVALAEDAGVMAGVGGGLFSRMIIAIQCAAQCSALA
jgi:hypothetical protein